jgi:hypothetical protein
VRYKACIPWQLIRRSPEIMLADLAGGLTCKRCGPKGPLPKILGVSRQRDARLHAQAGLTPFLADF